LHPREANIPVFGLGGSIGTPKDGITADVIVLSDFDELEKRKNEISGKIVVFNQPFQSYGQSVQYRFYGAIRAAHYGALASLIRSVSPAMTRNLHTGMMGYVDSVKKIPHAAISPEDAELLMRLQNRGITPRIKLYMEAQTLPDIMSYNVMGEVRGLEYPEQILAIGGHSDSWDAGTGAHDDASGCIATWEAVKLLKELNLIPKRTLRVVMWTNEENGVRGGNAYRDAHKHENHVLMFEMDGGAFRPSAIRLTAPDKIFNEFKKIEPLLKKVDDTAVLPSGGGVDIRPMMETGVPGMSLSTDDAGKYFWYHHAHSDTVDKIDKRVFNQCVAAIAIAIYIYADMPAVLLND
jgi:carboxypeptidase Q